MKIEKDTITFSSGNTAYANCGIIGINDELNIFEGYDGSIDWPTSDWKTTKLTADDMRELADYMIVLWQRFKDSLKVS